MIRNLFRSNQASPESSDSDSDVDISKSSKRHGPIKTNFRCSSYIKPKISQENNLFMIDTERIDPDQPTEEVTVEDKSDSISVPIDDEIMTILDKSVIKPGFDQRPVEEVVAKSWRQQKRERKAERERTKGQSWFDLPATELTEERQRDLELIRMRDTIDPKTHYRKEDPTKLPKYFQVGHIVEAKADFYSSRLTKKERKRTLVEEILHDQEALAKNKRRYAEIKAREAITKRGTFQRKSLSKRSKYKKPKQK